MAHNKRLLCHSPLSPGGNVAHLPSGSRPDSPLSPGRTWAHIIDMQNRGATTPLSSSEGASSPRELASSLPDGIGLGFPSPRARAKDGLGTMSAERTETLRRMAGAWGAVRMRAQSDALLNRQLHRTHEVAPKALFLLLAILAGSRPIQQSIDARSSDCRV